MTQTRYAEIAMPDRRPAGPIVAGLVTIALVLGLTAGASFALVPGTGQQRASQAKSAAAESAAPANLSGKGRKSARSARTARSASGPSASGRPTPAPGRKTSGGGMGGDGRSAAATGAPATYVTRELAVAPGVNVRGSGPIETITQAGTPGMRRVTTSPATGKVVKSVLVRRPVSAQATRRHSSAGKVVALTFDDGPHPTQTPAILRILAAEHIKATFFMTGAMTRYHPATARAVAAAGMLIGDHTEHHNLLPNMSEAKVLREIDLGAKSIGKITGVTPRWFRSPYGGVSAATERSAGSLGMRIAGWDVDSEDWRNPKPVALASYVLRHVRPGSIVLLHDGGGSSRASTVAALPKIISALKKRGYRFVTLDQL